MLVNSQYSGNKEVEDVLGLFLQMVNDVKAGIPIAQEVMSQLVAFIGLVPEVRALPGEVATESWQMANSGMIFGSLIVQALIKK